MDNGVSLVKDDTPTVERSTERWGGLSANQWVVLAAMGGLLLAIGATLVLVLRSGGIESADVLATVMVGPTLTSTPALLVLDAVFTPEGLYWPPNPQPLATPNAPGDLLWWDARFAYRRPVLLDVVASQASAGTWAQVIFDGEGAQRDGKMRADGADLRVLVWDGASWWEIPRRAQPRRERRGWDILFHLQGTDLVRNSQGDVYYVYYGNSFAEPAPVAEDAPETSKLLLALGNEEGVEWGPEVTWTANSTTTQTLVSPDGRIVIQRPPGGLRKDTRVRLRIVPATERNGYGPLPDFELHADLPPGLTGPNNIVRWDPPLTVVINWAGLPVDVDDLRSWIHFAYDTSTGAWYSVPVEFDAEQGLIRITTDQP